MSKAIYRVDHCGSFIRPDRLRKARRDFFDGRIGRQDLVAVQNTAILDVLRMQADAGLGIYSDGEFRRGFWRSAVSDEYFEGMENEGIDFIRRPYLKGRTIEDAEFLLPPNPVVKGKLRLKKRITADEIGFLKAHAPGPFKVTIPSPVTLSRASYQPGISSDLVYPAWHDFFADYTRLIAGEIAAMVEDGVTYVQLDAPHYTRFIVPDRRKELEDFGINFEQELSAAIEAENICLAAAKRDGVTTAVHICLGTAYFGPRGALGGAGEYDESLIGQLLGALDADVFLIEYSERSGSLDSMRSVPRNKIICLGILNVRDPRVETVDEIRRRIEAAARYVPLENLSLSPNCGFSGGAADAFVTQDAERRKLDVLVEAARQVWG